MEDPVELQLYDAACADDVTAASSLLSSNPGLDVNWGDDRSFTALHTAAAYGKDRVVKFLLAHPAINVNVRNTGGSTPLSLASFRGRVSTVCLLLNDPRVEVRSFFKIFFILN